MAREQRRLAAILATDVVGFSRLMGRDESGTCEARPTRRLSRFRDDLPYQRSQDVERMIEGLRLARLSE